mmetsp:Transcript_31467/g.90922  ORF Transcript_31467/g.90922 Transcript_31467/m.90922 type:complete len:304 (+) Transcript_31467:98-1009(+)
MGISNASKMCLPQRAERQSLVASMAAPGLASAAAAAPPRPPPRPRAEAQSASRTAAPRPRGGAGDNTLDGSSAQCPADCGVGLGGDCVQTKVAKGILCCGSGGSSIFGAQAEQDRSVPNPSASAGRDFDKESSTTCPGRRCFVSHKSTRAAVFPSLCGVEPAGGEGAATSALDLTADGGGNSSGGVARLGAGLGCSKAALPPRADETLLERPLLQGNPEPLQPMDCEAKATLVSGAGCGDRRIGTPMPWKRLGVLPVVLLVKLSKDADFDVKRERFTLEAAELVKKCSSAPGEADPCGVRDGE